MIRLTTTEHGVRFRSAYDDPAGKLPHLDMLGETAVGNPNANSFIKAFRSFDDYYGDHTFAARHLRCPDQLWAHKYPFTVHHANGKHSCTPFAKPLTGYDYTRTRRGNPCSLQEPSRNPNLALAPAQYHAAAYTYAYPNAVADRHGGPGTVLSSPMARGSVCQSTAVDGGTPR